MKLTSKQLKRIIAEEVSRVIAEASHNECRFVAVYDDGTFEFSVGDVTSMSCKVGYNVADTIENIKARANEYDVTDIDPASCEEVAETVHGRDFKDTESFEDTRRQDFTRHYRGPLYRGPRALLPTTER